MEDTNWPLIIFTGILGGLLGWCGSTAYITRSNYIPKIDKVQAGYIAPNKLEVECKDLDGNGERETIMKIGGKSYLLMDVDGKPVISAYEIKPAEVVQKE